jgi:hypothetical protein
MQRREKQEKAIFWAGGGDQPAETVPRQSRTNPDDESKVWVGGVTKDISKIEDTNDDSRGRPSQF